VTSFLTSLDISLRSVPITTLFETFFLKECERNMFRKKSDNYWALLFLFIVCGFITFVLYKTWEVAKDSAYKSCVLSLKDDLIATISNDKTVSEAIPIGREWRWLSKYEVDMLFNSPSYSKSVDCGNYPTSITGKDVQIAIRRINGFISMQLQINGRIDSTIQEIE
jgi:hypothetical protein